MKVDGPRTPRPAVGPKRTTGAKATSGAFSKLLRDGDAVAGPATAAPLTPLDPLLAVQASDPDQSRGAGAARAQTMLDRLEDLRHGLLLGIIPHDRLTDLAVMARQRQDDLTDPALRQILRDIELRARVELAKFERHR